MNIVLVGGTAEDELNLRRGFTGVESSFQVRSTSLPATPRLRALVFEAIERPELGKLGLALVRSDPHFDEMPLFLAVRPDSLSTVDPTSGFDELLVFPYSPEELSLRLQASEFRRSGSDGRERMGNIVLDHRRREVVVAGRPVNLTGKEFALFAYLWTQRGRVLSRRTLLERVWGSDYDVGPRAVDIHVRRLRVKLGGTVPLETLRGAGYKLRVQSGQAEAVATAP